MELLNQLMEATLGVRNKSGLPDSHKKYKDYASKFGKKAFNKEYIASQWYNFWVLLNGEIIVSVGGDGHHAGSASAAGTNMSTMMGDGALRGTMFSGMVGIEVDASANVTSDQAKAVNELVRMADRSEIVIDVVENYEFIAWYLIKKKVGYTKILEILNGKGKVKEFKVSDSDIIKFEAELTETTIGESHTDDFLLDVARRGDIAIRSYKNGKSPIAEVEDDEYKVMITWSGTLYIKKSDPSHPVPHEWWMGFWAPDLEEVLGVSKEQYDSSTMEQKAKYDAEVQLKKYVHHEYNELYAKWYGPGGFASLIGKVDEATLNNLQRKQRTISWLFPPFSDRVKKVGDMGGIRLKSVDDDNWNFKVHSGTKKDVWYDVVIHFKDTKETLDKLVRDRGMWVKDRSRIDLRRLAEKFINEVNVQTFCSCPADLYWGGHYIRGLPRYDAKYTKPEHRPPRKNNPKQYGAYCKHTSALMKTLPFYTQTVAKWLRDFYSDDIQEIEKKAKEEFGWAGRAAVALRKRIEPGPKEEPEKPKEKPKVRPRKERELKPRVKPEEEEETKPEPKVTPEEEELEVEEEEPRRIPGLRKGKTRLRPEDLTRESKINEMVSEEASEKFHEMIDDFNQKIVDDWMKNKDKVGVTQPWEVINASRLRKVWNDRARFGFIRDEKAVHNFADVIVENTVKLIVNTALMGHMEYAWLEDILDQTGIKEDDLDGFENYAVDEQGNWRISDYALDKLSSISMGILDSKSSEDLLLMVDAALNVVHLRSDLSSWFVGGGKKTLDQLANESINESVDIQKSMWKKTDDLTIYLVDGEQIRDHLYLDFTEGGHDLRYDFIPDNEVWIEKMKDPTEHEFILVHELHERRLMELGADYDHAHVRANVVETKCRNNPGLIRKFLNASGVK